MSSIPSLRNQAEFNHINKTGKKIYSTHFLIIVSKNLSSLLAVRSKTINYQPSGKKEIFFGMKVSKKMGDAVIRNKIKRRIRHLIRNIQNKITLDNSIGMIIIPKKGFDSVKFSELETALTDTLKSLQFTIKSA